MTYPETILTKPIRRCIMAFLFVVFFTVSPIIIFYTAGYRYDFKTHEVNQTGVLSIDVKPNETKVYLNDVLLKNNLPVYLPNRAPGTYTITLRAPGYKEWKKDVNIESKRTTYIKDVILFKESMPIQILTDFDKNIIDINNSFDGNYITLLTEEDGVFEIHLYDTKKEIINSLSRIKTINSPKINWSPFANYLTIETLSNKEYSLQILGASNEGNSQTYNYNTPIKYQWSKNTLTPSIFLSNDKEILLLTTNGQQNITTVSSTISNWYAENENSIWTYQNKTLSNGNKKYNIEDNNINIIDTNSNRIIYQTNHETKILKLDGNKITENYTLPTQQIIYNYETNEWITWSWWELWTIYNDGNTELLNRSGEKMTSLGPLDRYGVLFFANENKIKGFNPGYYVSHDLFSNAEIKKIFANIAERKIYFWGTVANKIGIFELEY